MITIRKGLRFTSNNFPAATAEIAVVRVEENVVDTIVTDSAGMSVVVAWPLDYVQFCFDNGIYTEIDTSKNISVGI